MRDYVRAFPANVPACSPWWQHCSFRLCGRTNTQGQNLPKVRSPNILTSRKNNVASHIQGTWPQPPIFEEDTGPGLQNQFLKLTGGGGLLAGAAGRGALARGVLAGPEVEPTDAGTGASPSSAIRDKYSLSIRALS